MAPGAAPEATRGTVRVGYYAHHHGRGHVARACAVLRHVRAPATLFTSAPVAPEAVPSGVALVRLAEDLPRKGGEARSPLTLHYAPLAHPGVLSRMAEITAWAARGPAVLAVDVSAEVTQFGRLLSLPVVAVRQHGDRTDAPHRAGYASAVACLAPFARALESPATPRAVRDATFYAGGISRFAGRQRPLEFEPRTVCLVGGGGSGGPGSARAWSPEDVLGAVRATPGWRWTWLGAPPLAGAPAALNMPGWVADPFPAMVRAEVVVTSGGHNATMEAAAAGRPLVVVPEPRPFAEQERKAEALARAGAALAPSAWPPPKAWADLLERARAMDPNPLRALTDAEAPLRAAQFLDRLAARYA